MPSPPVTLHAWHCPLHALPQQNPSTQNPLAHSPSPLHVFPCALMNVATTACAEVTFETM
jgi:hypothetical protein